MFPALADGTTLSSAEIQVRVRDMRLLVAVRKPEMVAFSPGPTPFSGLAQWPAAMGKAAVRPPHAGAVPARDECRNSWLCVDQGTPLPPPAAAAKRGWR